MKNLVITFAPIAAAAVASTAGAAVLLEVDVSVPDQITITATNGLSASSITDASATGFLLAGILDGSSSVSGTLVSGNLTSFLNNSNNSPNLSTVGADTGLNVSDYTVGTNSNFVANQIAFKGSATWDVDAAGYAAFASPGAEGDIWFAAKSSSDIDPPPPPFVPPFVLGQWVTVPTPGTAGALALAALAATRRRR